MSGESARRAVAYVRVSERQPGPGAEAGDEGSLAEGAQRRAIEEWADRTGVAVRCWQVDLGVGADTPIAERPALLAAYRAIREHDAGILVAANAERFAHDELVAWLIERAALTQGAVVRTADGSRARSRSRSRRVEAPEPAPEPVAYTRGALDLCRAYDRVLHGAKIRAALADKRARGERAGTIPYGYRLASDGVHVEPDEAEQAVVSSVRRLAAEGVSQRAIAAKLAARGVVGRTGAPLRQTQIAHILRSTG